MCLAPRYRNGAIAAPLLDWTNDASRFDTLCALATPGRNRAETSTTVTAITRIRCVTRHLPSRLYYSRISGNVSELFVRNRKARMRWKGEESRRTDHPVRGTSVASQLLN